MGREVRRCMGAGCSAFTDSASHTCQHRVEYMTSGEAKMTTLVSVVLAALALSVAVAQAVIKYQASETWLEQPQPSYFSISLGLAAAMFSIETAMLGIFTWHVRQAQAMRRRWSFRRGRIVTGVAVFAVLQLITLALWLASFAYIVATPCSWLNTTGAILGGLQWTCLNGQLLLMVSNHPAHSFF